MAAVLPSALGDLAATRYPGTQPRMTSELRERLVQEKGTEESKKEKKVSEATDGGGAAAAPEAAEPEPPAAATEEPPPAPAPPPPPPPPADPVPEPEPEFAASFASEPQQPDLNTSISDLGPPLEPPNLDDTLLDEDFEDEFGFGPPADLATPADLAALELDTPIDSLGLGSSSEAGSATASSAAPVMVFDPDAEQLVPSEVALSDVSSAVALGEMTSDFSEVGSSEINR